MKCTLTSKGRNVNLKSATYKVSKRLVVSYYMRIVEKKNGAQQEAVEAETYSIYVANRVVAFHFYNHDCFPLY
jgi:hypothetical protein